MLVEPSRAGQSEARVAHLRLCARKVRHHLARKQPHRLFRLGAADQAEIDLQRGGIEAPDLAVVGFDGVADVVGRADPGRALFDLDSNVSSEIDWIIFW